MSINEHLQNALTHVGSHRHRQLIIVSGNQDEVLATMPSHFAALATSTGKPAFDALWMGKGAPEGCRNITNGQAGAWLGTEQSAVVINAFADFDVDGAAALAGTIRPGGALFILTPPLRQWAGRAARKDRYSDQNHPGRLPSSLHSYYIERLSVLIATVTELLPDQNDSDSVQYRCLPITTHCLPSHSEDYLADEHVPTAQQLALINTSQVLDQTQAILLTADRGRGKSAALGMAAAHVLQHTDINSDTLQTEQIVALVAPSIRAVDTLNQYFLNNTEEGMHKNLIFFPLIRYPKYRVVVA